MANQTWVALQVVAAFEFVFDDDTARMRDKFTPLGQCAMFGSADNGGRTRSA
jgi:hypothetical protein